MHRSNEHLSATVKLMRFATPAAQCVCLRIGEVDEATLQILDAHRYDFAPVLDGDQAIGFVSTKRARELRDSGRMLSNADIIETRLPGTPSVDELLAVLETDGAALVVDAMGAPGRAASWLGFITFSDLNRHFFRSLVYVALADFEVRLADLLQASGFDDTSWLKALNEGAQAHVLGYWELARRQGVDTGPLTACTLVELSSIASSQKEVLREMGFSSKSEYQKHLGSLPQLRNLVMHPVRPMVSHRADVSDIHNKLRQMDRVLENVNAFLSSERAIGHESPVLA